MTLCFKQRFPLFGTGHVVAEGAYEISPDLVFVLQEKSTDEQLKTMLLQIKKIRERQKVKEEAEKKRKEKKIPQIRRRKEKKRRRKERS